MHGAAALEVLNTASHAAAEGFLATSALMVGQIGLAMIAPPVAVAIDIASALYDAATSIERYAADELATLAVLDPNEAIAAPGSGSGYRGRRAGCSRRGSAGRVEQAACCRRPADCGGVRA